MSSFNPQIVTKRGEELIARALASNGAIQWTRVALGDGSPLGDPSELEELISPKLDAILINNENLGETAELIVKFSNENIIEEFDIRELGIFGRIEGDAESVLYSYSTAGDCSRIPINSSPFELEWSIYTRVTNGEKIEILINPTQQMLNKETADSLYEKVFIKKTAHNKNFGTGSDEVPRGDHIHSFEEITGCSIRVKQFYITEDTENPAVTWPGTTWAKLEGRVLLGTSSGFALGTEGGAATVTLTKANLPDIKIGTDEHIHTKDVHVHRYSSGVSGQGDGGSLDLGMTSYNTDAAGGENTGAAAPMTEPLGNGEAFNIMNPFRAVHMWRRES